VDLDRAGRSAQPIRHALTDSEAALRVRRRRVLTLRSDEAYSDIV
jgi:hypothetical protein